MTSDIIRRVPASVAQESTMDGSPDDLCALLEEYAENGLHHVVLANITFMADLSKLRSSYESLARILADFS